MLSLVWLEGDDNILLKTGVAQAKNRPQRLDFQFFRHRVSLGDADAVQVVQTQDLQGHRWEVHNFSNTVWEAAIWMHHFFQVCIDNNSVLGCSTKRQRISIGREHVHLQNIIAISTVGSLCPTLTRARGRYTFLVALLAHIQRLNRSAQAC